MSIIAGQVIQIQYSDRDMDVVVIDPNGLGKGKPSVGLGLRMMEKYIGIRNDTLSRWISPAGNNEEKTLKTPSGKEFKVLQIQGLGQQSGNTYVVIETYNWCSLIGDVIKHPGKVRKESIHQAIDFLTWFSAQGIYAAAYTKLKDAYTSDDSESFSKWTINRSNTISGFHRVEEAVDLYLERFSEYMRSNIKRKAMIQCMDTINRFLFDKRSRQIKEQLGYDPVIDAVLIRDFFNNEALRRLDNVQTLTAAKIANKDMTPIDAVFKALHDLSFPIMSDYLSDKGKERVEELKTAYIPDGVNPLLDEIRAFNP